MKGSQIIIGQTYLFVATEALGRKHLEGMAFTVIEKKAVFRRLKKGHRKVNRFFNEDGVGARPEELEPLPERENGCSHCAIGEMIDVEHIPRANEMATRYECNNCGHTETFP